MELKTLVNKFGAYEYLTNQRLDKIEAQILELQDKTSQDDDASADMEARLATLEEARKVQIQINTKLLKYTEGKTEPAQSFWSRFIS